MTPGQAAQREWAKRVIHPHPTPWEKLPRIAKEGWEQIAQAAIEEYKRQNVVVCCSRADNDHEPGPGASADCI